MKGKICILLLSLSLVLVSFIGSCTKKEEVKEKPKKIEMKMEKEKVKCAYCGMKMYKSAMEATMEYKGKTFYFCTKEEMEEFKKDPEAYITGEKKGKMKMEME